MGMCLLIGNKRLWLSSLSSFSLVHAMDWAGREVASCRLTTTSELKVDIFVFEDGWYFFEGILVTFDVGLVLAR